MTKSAEEIRDEEVTRRAIELLGKWRDEQQDKLLRQMLLGDRIKSAAPTQSMAPMFLDYLQTLPHPSNMNADGTKKN